MIRNGTGQKLVLRNLERVLHWGTLKVWLESATNTGFSIICSVGLSCGGVKEFYLEVSQYNSRHAWNIRRINI